MVYLFTQDGQACVPFDGSKELYIYKKLNCYDVILRDFKDILICPLARYNSKEECVKAMELFYKKLNLGATVFQFPEEV